MLTGNIFLIILHTLTLRDVSAATMATKTHSGRRTTTETIRLWRTEGGRQCVLDALLVLNGTEAE